MKLSTGKTSRAMFGLSNWMSRALADTMPAVTVLVRSKGLPHGEHPIPDAHVIAVSPRQSSESVGVNAQDGDVRGRIAPDQFSGERAVVVEPDFDGIRPLDDVVVGDDEAVRRQDDPAARPSLDARLGGGSKKSGPPTLSSNRLGRADMYDRIQGFFAAPWNPSRGSTVASAWCAAGASASRVEASRSLEATPWLTSAVQWACWIERLSCSVGAPGWNWRTMTPPRMAEKRERKIVLWTIQLLCVWGNNAS